MMRVAMLALVAAGCSEAPARVGVEANRAPAVEVAPLKLWMTANLSRAMKAQELPTLGRGLAIVAANVPPDFGTWAAIAERGVRAAAAGDVEEVRRSCTDCHDRYRASYRERHRARAYPFEEP
jgi:hypothetical protein